MQELKQMDDVSARVQEIEVIQVVCCKLKKDTIHKDDGLLDSQKGKEHHILSYKTSQRNQINVTQHLIDDVSEIFHTNEEKIF